MNYEFQNLVPNNNSLHSANVQLWSHTHTHTLNWMERLNNFQLLHLNLYLEIAFCLFPITFDSGLVKLS